ncbi:hypothetical protein ACFVW8_02580 [Streptomyces sp. NPDC058221]|uniref:hypothetical protein n=1 Tax=Streptomyces sp. NPDC058221 TaxID=3346388 RepID=UPI0036EF6013
MAARQIIAPPSAPSSGVVHVNIRHTSGFTVVGNHLSQHAELSLTAIGLAVHIQSLPPGAKVGIKHLVERFPESEQRIAAALRELEEHGYLKRTRVHGRDGRVHTRTVSYNHPQAAAHGKERQRRRPAPDSAPPVTPASPPPPPVPPQPAEAEAVAVAPRLVPVPTAQKPPPPPLPRPHNPRPQLLHAAADLLVGLRDQDAQLVLTEADIEQLMPAVAAWFERGASPAAVRHALTADLPRPLRFPAKLLRHRLTALLPSGRSLPAAYRAVPLQNCDDCDRAFRASEPGLCDSCASESHQLTPA